MSRILVVGPGAIGSIVTYLFSQSGHHVEIFHHSEEKARIIDENGIMLQLPNGEKTVVKPKVITAQDTGDFDGIVYTTKSYQLEDALKLTLKKFRTNTYLFLQNGLKHVEIVSNYIADVEKIFFGVTTLGGFRINKNTVQVASIDGETTVAPFKESVPLPEIFRVRWIKYHPDYKSILWSKALINAAINPMTAVLEVRNGELARPGHWKIVKNAIKEILRVIHALNIELTMSDPEAYVLEVIKKTALNKSSMLQDIESGKRTENDYITGYILEISRRLGIEMPVNEALYNLVRIKEGESI